MGCSVHCLFHTTQNIFIVPQLQKNYIIFLTDKLTFNEELQVTILPSRKYQHDGQDRAGCMTEAETMPKSIHPYQQQVSIK